MGGVRHGQYESDLPLLELKYDPDMQNNTVTGLLTKTGELVGIEFSHISEEWNENLTLRSIGGMGIRKNKVDLNEYGGWDISMIGIVYDPEFKYVCNVVLGFEDEVVSLSQDLANPCAMNFEQMDNAMVLYTEDDYPIVGFHGRTENNRLVDLGVIWLD